MKEKLKIYSYPPFKKALEKFNRKVIKLMEINSDFSKKEDLLISEVCDFASDIQKAFWQHIDENPNYYKTNFGGYYSQDDENVTFSCFIPEIGHLHFADEKLSYLFNVTNEAIEIDPASKLKKSSIIKNYYKTIKKS